MRKRTVPPPPDKPVRYISCNENAQIFNWQKTSGRGSQAPETIVKVPGGIIKKRVV